MVVTADHTVPPNCYSSSFSNRLIFQFSPSNLRQWFLWYGEKLMIVKEFVLLALTDGQLIGDTLTANNPTSFAISLLDITAIHSNPKERKTKSLISIKKPGIRCKHFMSSFIQLFSDKCYKKLKDWKQHFSYFQSQINANSKNLQPLNNLTSTGSSWYISSKGWYKLPCLDQIH